jgi:hypothetical protein
VTRSYGRRPSLSSQRVVDPDHHCNFSMVPHLLLEHAAEGKLLPSAIVLYLHYKRVSYEQHGQPAAEGLRETKRRTGLSNGTILAARAALTAEGWVYVQEQGGEAAIVTLVERWTDNCRCGQILTTPGQKLTTSGQKPAAGGRKLTATHLSGARIKNLKRIAQWPAVKDHSRRPE